VALTTNGATLRSLAPGLRDAGLRRVNISLDTLSRDRFVELTRRDELDRVLDGIDAACEAGLDPVKVNVVVMRGVNDDEILDLARFGRDRGVTVRFIEWMPLDADRQWQSRRWSARPRSWPPSTPHLIDPVAGGSQPAERFALRRRRRGGRDPLGHPAFCRCDRIRLTAEAGCGRLFAVDEVDLRAPGAGGATDDDVGRGAALRGRQVGWSHDRPGRFCAPPPQHEPDRG
jgi:cyclic pyranopterin phosphate synthase